MYTYTYMHSHVSSSNYITFPYFIQPLLLLYISSSIITSSSFQIATTCINTSHIRHIRLSLPQGTGELWVYYNYSTLCAFSLQPLMRIETQRISSQITPITFPIYYLIHDSRVTFLSYFYLLNLSYVDSLYFLQ